MSQLTELAIRALKGSDKYRTVWDMPGFGVRVGKRTKTYVVVRGKNRERITIGRFDEMKLSEARAEAKRLLSAEPEAKSASVTFKAAREEFLETYTNAGTRYQLTLSLTLHSKPLEAMQLSDIGDTDIKRMLDRMQATPSAQLHAYRYLRTFFRWCLRPPRRYLKHSPMEGYEPPGRDRKGTRVLSDQELSAVWKAAGGSPRSVLRLMILWGTRNSETVLVERSWLQNGVLTIPGFYTKNSRDHSIPLGPLAQSLLDELPGGNERYFFPSRWGDSHLTNHALPKLKAEVMKASGTKDWQIRDLRRTFRSNMARLKVPRDVCELLINHAPPVLDEIYDRYSYVDEKREALAKYEKFIQALIAEA